MVGLSMLSFLVAGPSQELPAGWSVVAGDGWRRAADSRSVLLQRSAKGKALAVNRDATGALGAWRCYVEPSLGATRCGIWFLADEALERGYTCELGPVGEVGFALRTADGEPLWSDVWAPWSPYEAYILEGIVEPGRVRAQLLRADGVTLVSQSDWVAAPPSEAERSGGLAVFTEDTIARFWGAARSDAPLAEMTEDAPNRRRLAQGPESEWVVYGGGNWMWTDATRTRVRQYATRERAWALAMAPRPTVGTWRTSVRVSPGAGGAGMLVLADEAARGGFMCWLGGEFGAGCLMLYRNPGPGQIGECLWRGQDGVWHYDEDLTIEADTAPGRIRVRLLSGDGTTLLSESPWVEVSPDETAREGRIGFHTWLGSAEFWAFAGEAAPVAVTQRPENVLGGGWVALGGGQWDWADDTRSRARQTGAAESASCIATGIAGSRGLWRCTVVVQEGAQGAGLLFQANQDGTQGFLLLLADDGVAAYELARPTTPRWENPAVRWAPGEAYVLEGLVQTDRVTVRVLDATQGRVLAESPALYVSSANNDRIGHLGFAARGGPAEFSDWSFTPE